MTAYLRQCPKLPGSARFQATYTPVEVVAEEQRTVEYVHQERRDVPAAGGGFYSEYGPPEKRTRTETWVRIRLNGRLRWVAKFGNVFDQLPA